LVCLFSSIPAINNLLDSNTTEFLPWAGLVGWFLILLGMAEHAWTVRTPVPDDDGAAAPCRLVAQHDVCHVSSGTPLASLGLQASLEKLMEGERDATDRLRSGLGLDLVVDYSA
jgi:hypothetical protein